MTELDQYFNENPHHAVNGWHSADILQSINAGKPHITPKGKPEEEEDSDEYETDEEEIDEQDENYRQEYEPMDDDEFIDEYETWDENGEDEGNQHKN